MTAMMRGVKSGAISVVHEEQGLAHGQLIRAAVLKDHRSPFGAAGAQPGPVQLPPQLARRPFAAVDDGHRPAEVAGNGPAHEGIVGAAENDGPHAAIAKGEEEILQIPVQLRAGKDPSLDHFRQPFAGQGDHVGLVGKGGGQRLILVLPDGQGGGHDDHRGVVHRLRRRLDSRLDADDGQVGMGLPQQADGGAGGGVAGHHHGFDVLGQQPVHGGHRQLADLFQRFFPVGGVGGVPEKEKLFLGQQGHAGPQDADAPQAGVEDADRLLSLFHVSSPLWAVRPAPGRPPEKRRRPDDLPPLYHSFLPGATGFFPRGGTPDAGRA